MAQTEKMDIEVELDGESFAFAIRESDFAKLQRDLKKMTDGSASKNFLLATAVAPTPEELEGRFKKDWTLSGVLMEPIVERLGGFRAARLKK